MTDRCARIGAHYGYTAAALAVLGSRGESIAVPFFDVRRLLFALSLQRDPAALAMAAAFETTTDGETVEFGNALTVVPISSVHLPGCSTLYLKRDVSKTMVVYQHDDELEHLGAEERAALFARLARDWLGLEAIPLTAWGLLPSGELFVATAGLPAAFTTLSAAPTVERPSIEELHRLAVLDFVLGQNDRNAENVMVAPRALALIDNDDSFATTGRLATPFAYLSNEADDQPFAPGLAWFSRCRLSTLVSLLAPLALPARVLGAMASRFGFIHDVVTRGWSVRDFKRAAFTTPEFGWALPQGSWAECRTFIDERPGQTLHRTVVAEPVGAGYDVTTLAGAWLTPEVVERDQCTVPNRDAAAHALSEAVARCTQAGYRELLLRRFFASTEAEHAVMAILEVRTGAAGFEVITKRGELGRYGAHLVHSATFSTAALALAEAKACDLGLRDAGFVDLRTRLEAFRAPPPPVLF